MHLGDKDHLWITTTIVLKQSTHKSQPLKCRSDQSTSKPSQTNFQHPVQYRSLFAETSKAVSSLTDLYNQYFMCTFCFSEARYMLCLSHSHSLNKHPSLCLSVQHRGKALFLHFKQKFHSYYSFPKTFSPFLKWNIIYSIQLVPETLSPVVKRPGREADYHHLVPMLTTRGAIPPLSQYAFIALCLIKKKHKDKSTFYLSYWTIIIP